MTSEALAGSDTHVDQGACMCFRCTQSLHLVYGLLYESGFCLKGPACTLLKLSSIFFSSEQFCSPEPQSFCRCPYRSFPPPILSLIDTLSCSLLTFTLYSLLSASPPPSTALHLPPPPTLDIINCLLGYPNISGHAGPELPWLAMRSTSQAVQV